MNTSHYDEIFNQFATYHPYLADKTIDVRPRGESGIRVTLRDGTKYDFYQNSATVRRVDSRPAYSDDELTEDKWREIFKDRLQEKMVVSGYTQQSLSEHTGLSKGAINKYVNGDSIPSGYALTKIARALDCLVAELTE
jgi:ribosome-binding protein aMBF1 (putative translation factor)